MAVLDGLSKDRECFTTSGPDTSDCLSHMETYFMLGEERLQQRVQETEWRYGLLWVSSVCVCVYV